MRRILALGAVLSLVLPSALLGQSADDLLGRWTFERETPRGTFTQTFVFTLADGELAGTLETPRGEVDLGDVSLEDGVLSFTLRPPGGPRGGNGGAGGPPPDRVQTFRGILDGDEIAGELDTPRGAMPVVLKRLET